MPIIDGRRKSSRLIIVDAEDSILLTFCRARAIWDELQPRPFDYWMTPGGGVEAGETWEDAARRELIEETGLELTRIGPVVAMRQQPIRMRGLDYISDERYFLIATQRFDTNPVASQDQLKVFRWWTMDELARTEHVISPPGLPDLLATIRRDGITASPLLLAHTRVT